ncbi:MAG TPA: PAS domain-containing protein [Thermoleophilaceae bacterium]|jgi:PAS domain-containing protein
MEAQPQKPLQLILARNLLASLSTPAFLVDAPGDILFYNEAAGGLLGRPFEGNGQMTADEWLSTFGPFDPSTNEAVPLEDQALTRALRANRPGHAKARIRAADGTEHDIAVSGVPIVGPADGFTGAMIFFWPDPGADPR